MENIYFNSRKNEYKNPFGAVPQGTKVNFKINIKNKEVTRVRLVVEEKEIIGNYEKVKYKNTVKVSLNKSEGCEGCWEGNFVFNNVKVYGYYFEIEENDRIVYYANNDNSYGHTIFKFYGTGGEGKLYLNKKSIVYFNQSVYCKDFKVPEWSKKAVYYQIFPERFKNGDKSNDPQNIGRKFYNDIPIEYHEDWNEAPYTKGDGKGDDIHCNDFFGGDLKGITEKMEYIKELGVNTLYINPIFQASSNHKYDCIDYKKIDESFGDLEDFKELLKKAHDLNIRVVLDASINHCGYNSVYMDIFNEYSGDGAFCGGKIVKDSPYREWFKFKKSDKVYEYNKWLGVESLAQINEVDDFKNFAYRDEDSVSKYWLHFGLDGWRMDVTPWKSDNFWREWRHEVKKCNEDNMTIAEVWWDSSKYLLGDMFDSTMNYLFRYAVINYINGESGETLWEILEMIRENYPSEAFYALMNLISSHDVKRALCEFGYEEDTTREEMIKISKEKLVMALMFQVAYPGAPCIYYGDEVGVTGGDDPLNRRTYPWEEDGGNPDNNLLSKFRKIIAIRSNYDVFNYGDVEIVYKNESIIIFKRSFNEEEALCMFNNSLKDIEVNINVNSNFKSIDNVEDEGDFIKLGENSIKLKSLSGKIYIKSLS